MVIEDLDFLPDGHDCTLHNWSSYIGGTEFRGMPFLTLHWRPKEEETGTEAGTGSWDMKLRQNLGQ